MNPTHIITTRHGCTYATTLPLFDGQALDGEGLHIVEDYTMIVGSNGDFVTFPPGLPGTFEADARVIAL
jgi:hypothetical protein